MREIPVSYGLKCRIEDRIKECIDILYNKTGYRMENPFVKYDLTGRTAGMAVYSNNGPIDKMRVNVAILVDHTEDYIRRTVAHEIAHIFAHRYYQKLKGIIITSHGKHWKYVMMMLGVQDIGRCHSYSLRTEEVRRQRRFLYACPCKTFNLSTTRHNKIKSGRKYFCTDCQRLLVYQGEEL